MQALDIAKIRRWNSNNRATFPAAISAHCPHCMSLVTFSLSYPNYDAKRLSINHSALCPACEELVHFTTQNDEEQNAVALYMFPECTDFRERIYTQEQLQAPIYRAYKSLIDSLNAGHFYTAATGCARALELCLRNLADDAPDNATLEDLINHAVSNTTLIGPLNSLAPLVRKGGQLRRFFDMEIEPDREKATAMVDLVENLISYLFTLPKEIEDLERSLVQLDLTPVSSPFTPSPPPANDEAAPSHIRQITLP